MTYIYDILANFNKEYFDFYDWNEDDSIVHIKKLPIIRVNSDFLYNLKYNDICVDKNLINKINRKVDYFKQSQCNKVNYVSAFCDLKESIIIRFDDNGNIISRSSFLIDEGNEVIDLCENLECSDYSYEINNTNVIDSFKTRYEKEIEIYIQQELNNINEDKLKYLYFDCFNKEENDISIIYNNIMNEIKGNFSNTYMSIYNFLKLTSFNK